ncbi:centromere protein O-like [Gigaspora margarita]|uniref:Centromere protein O-like n=1 Tax=Gigaspora margarita TaxID=4874 RepID=A0A8H3XMF0_GIGMA|nr:centromere protein O-like [Gigaspora margarita]
MSYEVQKLLKKRDELKRVLEVEENSIMLRDIISKENFEIPTIINFEIQEKMVQDMFRVNKRRECDKFLKAYRLTGKTIFSLKENQVGLRFETFYGGKYREPYYVFLSQDEENDQLNIFKHTIPHFIPLNELESDYLNKDIDKFINTLDDYLQAFVTRREETRIMQQDVGVSNLKTNNAYNSIEFSVRLKESVIEFNLIYEDLKLTTPTDVVMYQIIEDDDDKSVSRRQRLRRREKEFTQLNLVNAFSNMFSEVK